MKVIRVFISYAHEKEPPNYREQVKQFIKWIHDNCESTIKIVSDFDHTYKAPKQGWPVWMEDQIEQSDIVLMACSPSYLQRFRKKETGSGMGVTWEGAIITQDLYETNLHNDKFIPIIPDGGSVLNIPSVLRGFFNGFSFPTNNAEIVKAICTGFNLDEEEKEATENIDIETVQIQILTELSSSVSEPLKNMSKVEVLIRAFLTLNDVHKNAIVQELGVYEDRFKTMAPIERYKAFFKIIKEKKLLPDLWDKINQIKPFDYNQNPFKP